MTGDRPPPPVPVPASVDIYYAETTEAQKHLLTVIANYRSNTTTLLAVATGAAAFFGFSDGSKGILFALALSAYACAAAMAMWVYWPVGIATNMAQYAGEILRERPPPSVKQAKFRVMEVRQRAIGRTELIIGGGYVPTRTSKAGELKPVTGLRKLIHIVGLSWRFRALVLSVGLTVVFAGANSIVEQPEKVTEPTRIIIEGVNR